MEQLSSSDQESLETKPLVAGFANANIRMGFIRKVYSILAFQLSLTTLISLWALLTINAGLGFWLLSNQWIFYITMPVSIILVIVLSCVPFIARSVPINYILTLIFTIAISIAVAMICAMYQFSGFGTDVYLAFGSTATITIGLTLYAFMTKKNFTYCGGVMFSGAGMLFFLFACTYFFRNTTINYWIYYPLTFFGAILFSFYIIYDTQLIMGKHKHKFKIDDYIMAAMSLYLDIINIFLNILYIFARNNQIFKRDYIFQTD